MYGFDFGADHKGRSVGNIFVVDYWTCRTGERCSKLRGVVSLVYDEADEVVFPLFLVELYEIEELR